MNTHARTGLRARGRTRAAARASVLLAVLLSACGPAPEPNEHVHVRGHVHVLTDARDVGAIASAYAERVRLGLGSPFRIMEIAARDERLPADEREELLASLFDDISNGDTYQIGATLPLAHYRVIASALGSAHDPRIAELAINLAYEVALAEKSVTPELQYAAASTAALLRDRALAKWDAQRVRDVARDHRQQPHTLVPALRATRQLLVEQPLQPALNHEAQEEASRLALLLVGGVRQAQRTPGERAAEKKTSELERDVAERILALQQTAERPPQSAVIIALRAAQLSFSARDEETFVAELALQDEQSALAAQRVAIALRPYAQEPVWYAGLSAPGGAELLARYGVRVAFDDSVPAQWHDYYRFLLDHTLADLQRVAPGIHLKGLTIEVGEVAPGAAHLAYHDPRQRVIRWAPATGSGSLAHEIAHDLDWQIARRSYGKAGYGSDLATDVAAMLLLTRGDTAITERGTEVFARQFDWVAAAALAAQGRMNGHLSSVQHDWLPGHGSARPPLANSRSANALAGLVARGGRLGEAGRVVVEQAVVAAGLPASVHAVRQLRHDTQRLNGPRVSAFSPDATAEFTHNYVSLLARSAGTGLHYPTSTNNSYLLLYY